MLLVSDAGPSKKSRTGRTAARKQKSTPAVPPIISLIAMLQKDSG